MEYPNPICKVDNVDKDDCNQVEKNNRWEGYEDTTALLCYWSEHKPGQHLWENTEIPQK